MLTRTRAILTYANGGAGGCEPPSPQGPLNILSGDIQIQNPLAQN